MRDQVIRRETPGGTRGPAAPLDARAARHRGAMLPVLACLVAIAAACGDEGTRAAMEPAIAASPATLDFGRRPPATRTTFPLVLTNEGGGRLDLSSARIEDDRRGAFSLGTLPDGIGTKQSASIEVTYAAEREGLDEGVLVIESNSRRSSTLRVPLVGHTLPPCAADLTYCDETCTDLRRDAAHCGTCERRCGDAEVCVAGECAPPSCSDEVQDGSETGVDCGGSCAGCPPGGACSTGSDCASAICKDGRCSEPTCIDRVKNGRETDVDCGGACGACDDGETCATDADCVSQLCVAAVCTAMPALSIAGSSSDEGTGVTFLVSLSAPIGEDVTFAFATADRTALVGLDYEALSGRGLIEAGKTSTKLVVATTARARHQGDRTFTMSIGSPGHATISTSSATGTILETSAEPPSSLTYSPTSLVCTKDRPCLLGAPASSGGTVASYEISPALPAGLNIDASTGAISGTATVVSPAATYTVTATNSGGSATATITVTVKDAAPAGLAYSPPSLVCTRDDACSLAAPTSSGGAVVSYEISPALPIGLGLHPRTGAISGTPTVLASAATYTVTATNTGGSTTATITIAVVDPAPTGLRYTPSSLVCTRGAPCALGAPTSSGGAVVSYAISPALPAGLQLDASTGAISGTPTVTSSATTHTVTATNSGGSTTATVTVTVNDAAPSGLSYTPDTLTCTVGQACSLGPPTKSGGAVLTWSVSPALPAGLTISQTDGTISGTPTAVAAATACTVTATNTGGTATATVTITVAASEHLDALETWNGHANAVKLSDTRIVVAYSDGASDRTVAPTSIVFRILDRSGDTFAFSGAPVRINVPLCPANNDQCIQLMGALGPSHFLMVTSDSTYARNYRLFKVSGTSITLVQSTTAGGGAWFWGHPVDDTRYIVRYRESNSGNPVKYRVVTRSGDGISLGTAIDRPAPSSFSGLSANEPQADAPLSRTGAATFREVRPGYVWTPGYLGSWVLTVSGSTLGASGAVVHSNSQQKTMSPHIASDGSGNAVVLYPSYGNGWHAGYFIGATFSTNGSISDTSGYYGGQGGDSTDGFINGAYYVRLRNGTLYRFGSVSSAPTERETGLPYATCYNAPGILKSGDYGVFLTCTSNGPLRIRTLKL